MYSGKTSGREVVARSGIRAVLACIIIILLQASEPCGAASAPNASMRGILESLEKYAVSLVGVHNIPGMAYAVLKDDVIVYSKGFGVKKQGGADAVDEHTVFEIGSASKAFTTTLLAMLVDEGKLAWKDKVSYHLPGFKMYNHCMTEDFMVEDLVCQRAGIKPYSLDTMSYLGFGRADIIHALRYLEPIHPIRSSYGYVNNLFLVAGRLIQKKTGLSWEDAVTNRILALLGMMETTAYLSDFNKMPNTATGHMNLFDGGIWTIPKGWRYEGWLQTYGPPGGIRSNVLDMCRWMRLNLGRGTYEGYSLVSGKGMDYLYQPKIHAGSTALDNTDLYASGWVYTVWSPQPIVWHNGATMGMHSIVALFPAANMGIVVLTNTNVNPVPELMMRRLYDLYYGNPIPATVADAIAGLDIQTLQPVNKLPPRPAVTLAALPLKSYVGDYKNPAYGTVRVRLKKGSLIALLDPMAIEAPLTPFSGNTFVVTLPDWPERESLATFVMGPGGSVKELFMQLFSDVKGGICLPSYPSAEASFEE